MSERYKLRLSKQDRRLYDIWNRQHPVSEWERTRNQRIACVQGNANPFVGPTDPRNCHRGKKAVAAR